MRLMGLVQFCDCVRAKAFDDQPKRQPHCQGSATFSKERVEENRHRCQRKRHREDEKCTQCKPRWIGCNAGKDILAGNQIPGNDKA